MHGERNQCIAQLIQRLAQGCAPKLVVGQASVASAVRTPPFHSVDTAPGGIFFNLAFVLRRVLREEHAVVRQPYCLVVLEQQKRVSKRHLAVLVVVAVGFSVRGHVHKLRLRAFFEPRLQPRVKHVARIQQTLERYCP